MELRALLLCLARPLGLAPYHLDPDKRKWRLSRSWIVFSALLLTSTCLLQNLGAPPPTQTVNGIRTAKSVLSNIAIHLYRSTNVAWTACTCTLQHRALMALMETIHLELGSARVAWGCLLPAAGAALLYGHHSVPAILQAIDESDHDLVISNVSHIVMGMSKTMTFVLFAVVAAAAWRGISRVEVKLREFKVILSRRPADLPPLADDTLQLAGIRRHYNIMKQVMDTAVASFGSVLLPLVLMHVWLVTTCAYLAFIDIMHGRTGEEARAYLAQSFGALFILGYTVWVTDLIQSKTYEILKLTHRLRNSGSLSTTANFEMEAFATQLHESASSVQVCGVLTLSKKHLFEVVAGGLAYLIIVLQFYP